MLYLYACLSFVIAMSFASLELATSKYPQTALFLVRSKCFWAYAATYGAIAFVGLLALDTLISTGTIKIEGLGTQSLLGKSLLVGLSAKALLHIRLFNVMAGSKQFPVGTETIVQLFEPWLLRQIEIFQFNTVRAYVSQRASLYPDFAKVKTLVRNNVPPNMFANDERVAFDLDVDRKENTVESMEHFLYNFGTNSFDRVFPETVADTTLSPVAVNSKLTD